MVRYELNSILMDLSYKKKKRKKEVRVRERDSPTNHLCNEFDITPYT